MDDFVSIPSLMGKLLGLNPDNGEGLFGFRLNTLADGQAPRTNSTET